MCCTGAHLLAKTGKEKRLPTTATAQKMPAMDNLRMFVFFIMTTPYRFDRGARRLGTQKNGDARLGVSV